MNTEKLSQANIPESWWPNCYISPDDMIFTPTFDKTGAMIKTGEQVYNEWIANKGKTAQPSEIDLLKDQVVQLKSAIALRDAADYQKIYGGV